MKKRHKQFEKHAVVAYDISQIEFNKFYILTQCSTFIGFNWQVKEFTLIKSNNSHALALTFSHVIVYFVTENIQNYLIMAIIINKVNCDNNVN